LAQLDVNRTRDLLQAFEFQRLFLEELGWEKPTDSTPRTLSVAGRDCYIRPIAALGGVAVLEVIVADGEIPDAKARLDVWREVIKTFHENLLIFVDGRRSQSIWEWFKRDGSKVYPRPHHYFLGQPGDLFLSKLSSLVVDLADLDQDKKVPVADVALRLKRALDVERVTKRFYNEFREEHERFLDLIEGIEDDRDRRWYASVLLNRLMFVYFLQRKHFLDKGDYEYLQNKLAASQARGKDRFYDFLKLLFFEGFAKPAEERSPETRQLLGEIRYLDGGLFLRHKVELGNPEIHIPDPAFEGILRLFSSYSWNLNDTPGGDDQEINPDVLGYIFEKYINQKAFGAYYTRPEITRYLCERTIYPLILSKVNTDEIPGLAPKQNFEAIEDLFLKLDARLCRKLLDEILPSVSILDPACGSGAFLVAALKVLIDVYSAVVGRAKFTADAFVQSWLRKAEKEHPSLNYGIKKRIITDNLFGVDIMEEATEITKLRLYLALVASATHVEDLEPLPNIDFNILAGNSLIGLLHVQAEEFDSRQSQGNLFRRSYKDIVAKKNRQIESYRRATSYAERLQAIRDEIEVEKQEANATLNWMLLSEFNERGIKFEQATWDERAKKAGKTKRHPVAFKDVEALRPFHWGYEFDQTLEAGGFDVILTNPPWEVFKPEAKEFFLEYSGIIKKNKMTIEEFEKEQARLLKKGEVQQAWLEYQSRFPHVSLYFRTSPEYENQISIVNGKKVGTDINLYKLFLERCFRLIRDGGRCGILLPTSFYSDLGSKRLRELLFSESRLEVLFGLSNERFLFEGVDHRFRICLVVFEKGHITDAFEAAFRIDPREAVAAERLESFLSDRSQHLVIPLDLVTRLAPDSLSVMELRSKLDIQVATKINRFPRLGEKIPDVWNFVLVSEFHIRNDREFFVRGPGPRRLPLFTGRMFNQFCLTNEHSGYWLDEEVGRKALLGKEEDKGQILDYQCYRWVHRRIARSTDSRTMISTLAPPGVFTELNSTTIGISGSGISLTEMVYLCAVTNSFVFDWYLRQKVSSTLNKFYIYQVPVPRLTENSPEFRPIIERTAKLICTRSEYAELWAALIAEPWSLGLGETNLSYSTVLRAETDALVAHLYGLTEEEFIHILSSFPVVTDITKNAALEAYRQFAPRPGDPEIGKLISQGESHGLEFKSTIRWDLKERKENPELKKVVQETVAGFLNADGGVLLLGVADDGSVIGLEPDLSTLKKKNRDGYELFLMDTLLGALGKDVSRCLRISFHLYDGKEVCRVTIAKSSKPVYIEGALYVRTGNSKRSLSLPEAVEYVKAHWT
jgi:schlafen family protein/Eco57I restriction-modification methylase